IRPFGKPGSTYAFGLTIDSRMNDSSGFPALCASWGSLSRSGPTFPVAPAALKVWQLAQPLLLKTALPEVAAGPPSFFFWPFARVVEAPGELLRRHVHDERPERIRGGRGVRQVLVLREHDCADDRDRGDECGRDRRPDDLEPGVPVDRRAVRVLVRLRPELDD